METEMLGEGYDEEKIQFEPCKYRNVEGENNGRLGFDNKCEYMDNEGNCIFENCRYEQEETPPHVEEWWYTCVACKRPASINPKYRKIHLCHDCIRRINNAEVLPFTCRYCGKQSNEPSDWWGSRVCNSCLEKLYNPNCKNYWCRGARHQV